MEVNPSWARASRCRAMTIKLFDFGEHAEPTRVGNVRRIVSVARAGREIPSARSPTAALGHATMTACWSERVGDGVGGELAEPIRRPFPRVANHIVQAPRI